MKLSLIENLKQHNNETKESDLLDLPITPFGDFKLKWLQLIERFDNVNDLIVELQNLYPVELPQSTVDKPFARSKIIYKHKFLTEQIIYWLKKSADELSTILYILDYQRNNSIFPEELEIDCIGHFINKPHSFHELLSEHKDYLKVLNDVANAYKHSILNSDDHYRQGAKEPIVFALQYPTNRNNNTTHSYKLALEDILLGYISFLEDVKELIKTFVITN
ncbi:hypothetical protein ACFFLS_06215 [Flavobacterium procerum]|uniref:Cthe-2314-like HEPN domain-containing protein n=1 Tax=Flavobacterium procerum TaxID=1455569 RepID=A0ABV6BMF5_9FLAO